MSKEVGAGVRFDIFLDSEERDICGLQRVIVSKRWNRLAFNAPVFKR